MPPMLTLGIDLASDPRRTGVCVLEWRDGGAAVRVLEAGAGDARLVRLHGECDSACAELLEVAPDEQAVAEAAADYVTCLQ